MNTRSWCFALLENRYLLSRWLHRTGISCCNLTVPDLAVGDLTMISQYGQMPTELTVILASRVLCMDLVQGEQVKSLPNRRVGCHLMKSIQELSNCGQTQYKGSSVEVFCFLTDRCDPVDFNKPIHVMKCQQLVLVKHSNTINLLVMLG